MILRYGMFMSNYELEKIAEEKAQMREEYKEQVEILIDDKKQLEEEVKQLKEALRKCSPNNNCGCEFNRGCRFCDSFYEHADDCEYIKLIESEE